MVFVMFACMSPWVKNRASTLKINALRLIKLPDRMGWELFLSARARPARLTIAEISTMRNGVDVQPKFCPKDGIHSSKLKKIRIKTAPDTSKFCSGFFMETSLREVRKQAAKIPVQIATHTHIHHRDGVTGNGGVIWLGVIDKDDGVCHVCLHESLG